MPFADVIEFMALDAWGFVIEVIELDLHHFYLRIIAEDLLQDLRGIVKRDADMANKALLL